MIELVPPILVTSPRYPCVEVFPQPTMASKPPHVRAAFPVRALPSAHDPHYIAPSAEDNGKVPHITLPPIQVHTIHDMMTAHRSPVDAWLDRHDFEETIREMRKEDLPKNPLTEFVVPKHAANRARYFEKLKKKSTGVVEIDAGLKTHERVRETTRQMIAGAEVILNASFIVNDVLVVIPVLRKTKNPAGVTTSIEDLDALIPDLMKPEMGVAKLDFHYTPENIKPAETPNYEHVLELAIMAHFLGEFQQVVPAKFTLVTAGDKTHEYKTGQHIHYARHEIKKYFKSQQRFDETEMPEITLRGLSPWLGYLRGLKREHHDVSSIPGISPRQAEILKEWGYDNLTKLTVAGPPRVPGISPEHCRRLATKARLMLQNGSGNTVKYEVDRQDLLSGIPKRTADDVFVSVDKSSLVGGSRVYGVSKISVARKEISGPLTPNYEHAFAATDDEERTHFEALIADIAARFRSNKDFHVFVHEPHEIEWLKLIALKHQIKLAEIDELTKASVFVSLRDKFDRAIAATCETDDIFNLNSLLATGDDTKNGIPHPAEFLALADLYFSTTDLREKEETLSKLKSLHERRLRLVANLQRFLNKTREEKKVSYQKPASRAEPIERAVTMFDKIGKTLIKDKDTPKLVADLKAKYAGDIAEGNEKGRAVSLVIETLGFHARERMVEIAELKSRMAKTDAELLDDTAAIGAARVAHVKTEDKKTTVALSFDHKQEFNMDVGTACLMRAGNNILDVKVVKLDFGAGTIEVEISNEKLGARQVTVETMASLIPNDFYSFQSLHDGLYRLAQLVLDRGPFYNHLIKAVLTSEKPFVHGISRDDFNGLSLDDIALHLDHSPFLVQGPPGTGKTHAAAEAALALIQHGKKVILTGFSHAAKNHLAHTLVRLAKEKGVRLNGVSIDDNDRGRDPELKKAGVSHYGSVSDWFRSGRAPKDVQFLAAMPSALSDTRISGYHTIIVDEAGQFTLANTLPILHATENIIGLGDPTQNRPPVKALHKQGSGVSFMGHMLKNVASRVVPKDFGKFLAITNRLRKRLAEMISRNFYDDQLTTNRVDTNLGHGRQTPEFEFQEVRNDQARRRNDDEVMAAQALVAPILASLGIRPGEPAEKQARVIVMAPYVTQVRLLKEALKAYGAHVLVGTIDSMQGREADYAVVSLTTGNSGGERGVWFALNPHRLVVALTRAREKTIVVGNPDLLDARPETPEDIIPLNVLAEIRSGASS